VDQELNVWESALIIPAKAGIHPSLDDSLFDRKAPAFDYKSGMGSLILNQMPTT